MFNNTLGLTEQVAQYQLDYAQLVHSDAAVWTWHNWTVCPEPQSMMPPPPNDYPIDLTALERWQNLYLSAEADLTVYLVDLAVRWGWRIGDEEGPPPALHLTEPPKQRYERQCLQDWPDRPTMLAMADFISKSKIRVQPQIYNALHTIILYMRMEDQVVSGRHGYSFMRWLPENIEIFRAIRLLLVPQLESSQGLPDVTDFHFRVGSFRYPSPGPVRCTKIEQPMQRLDELDQPSFELNVYPDTRPLHDTVKEEPYFATAVGDVPVYLDVEDGSGSD